MMDLKQAEAERERLERQAAGQREIEKQRRVDAAIRGELTFPDEWMEDAKNFRHR